MALFVGFAPNRAAVSEMAILRAGNHIFGRDARRDDGNQHGFGRQPFRRRDRGRLRGESHRRRQPDGNYGDGYPTVGTGVDTFHPADYRPTYGRVCGSTV